MQTVHDRFPILDNVLVEVWKYRRSGRRVLDERFSIHNLVTDAGRDLTADHIINTATATIGYFAVGGSTTPATIGDSALGTEIFRDVVTSATRTSPGLATITYFLSTLNANGNTLAEIGLLTAPSSGILFARAILTPVISKNNTKAVTFTWNITYA